MSAVFGIAAAAGYSLKADGREGVGGAQRIVVEDAVEGQRVLPENRQRAIARRADADITLAVVPLARSARIGVHGLLVQGDAGVVSNRPRSIGESKGIRVEASVQ